MDESWASLITKLSASATVRKETQHKPREGRKRSWGFKWFISVDLSFRTVLVKMKHISSLNQALIKPTAWLEPGILSGDPMTSN